MLNIKKQAENESVSIAQDGRNILTQKNSFIKGDLP